MHKNGKPNQTINQRISRGYAIVGQIFALLNDLPIGNMRTEIGLALRQAWLVNGILYNSEVWHNVPEYLIEQLVKTDKYLLRGLVGAHSKVPLEHLYLELAALPLDYVISARRMIYLQTILKRHDDELTKKIYRKQSSDPVRGDWCELVKHDFEKCNLEMTEDAIMHMSENEYKTLVKKSVRNAAFCELEAQKENHSKVRDNKYEHFERPQQYISCKNITNTEVAILFGLRKQNNQRNKRKF